MRRGWLLSLVPILFLSGCDDLEEAELCRELMVHTGAALELHLNSQSYSIYPLEKVLSLSETEKFRPSEKYIEVLRAALGRTLQEEIFEQKAGEFESNPKVREYLSAFDQTPELSKESSFNAVQLCASIETLARENEKNIPEMYAAVGDQFMQTLDSNSHYLSRERFASIFGEEETSLGFEAWFTEGKPALVSLVYDGLRAAPWLDEGDSIQSVNGKSVNSLTEAEWKRVWKDANRSGDLIEFLVKKQSGERGRLRLRAEVFPKNKVQTEVLRSDSGRKFVYLRWYSFDEEVGERVKEELTLIGLSDKAGMIIDLRGNGGGYVSAAQELAGYFIGKSRSMSYDRNSSLYERIRSRRSDWTSLLDGMDRLFRNESSVKLWNGEIYHVRSAYSDQRYTDERGFSEPSGLKRTASTSDPVSVGMPILILMDRNSASASELFAGALVDWGVALVAGELSYGKGVSQVVLPLGEILDREGWGAVSLVTMGEFLRPSGRAVQSAGITPHIEMNLRFANGYPAKRMKESENPILSSGDRLRDWSSRFIMREGLVKAFEEAKERDAKLGDWIVPTGAEIVPLSLDLFEHLLDAEVYEHSSILTFDPEKGALLRHM